MTGLNQKTANYPGVTVESKSGYFSVYDSDTKKSHKIEILDLPGIYSLDPLSEDERQAVSPILSFAGAADKEDVLLLFVADTCNPSRSLHLFFALRDMGFKMALFFNMASLAFEKGIVPDEVTIRAELASIPVLISGPSRGKTAHEIRKLVRLFGSINPSNETEKPYIDYIHKAADAEKKWFRFQSPANKIKQQAKADKILMHPLFGPLIFLLIMFAVFQSLFSISAYPMDWIESGMAILTGYFESVLPKNELSSLFTEGVLPGLTGIFIFIPQIAFLFFFISIMEESGYLSRVTFLADNLMRRFGLNGKSLIPFAGGAACAVPAILSARTISDPRERLITILVTPLVTCSARLPVFVTLIAVFVPESETGYVSRRALVLGGFYLLGILSVFMGALLLNLTLKKKFKSSIFMMELPDYRLPSARSVFKIMWGKVTDFVLNAGKIILAISIVLWVLASYGPAKKMAAVNAKYEQIYPDVDLKQNPGYRSEKLEASFAGHFGKWMEPVIKPLGYDWKIGIGLLTSFAAREVFVGTMNTIYGLGADAGSNELSVVMAAQTNPETGKKLFNAATSLSLMVFFLLAMQCMSTFAVVKRETGSLKIALAQLLLMTLSAYFAAFAVYRIVSML